LALPIDVDEALPRPYHPSGRPPIVAPCAGKAINDLTATADALHESPVAVFNRAGRGRVLLICEHASPFIPAAYRGLGLDVADLQRHIAWDIGALGLAQALATRLDAPLVHATYSRLLLDLNRPVEAADSIVQSSEGTAVPGNAELSSREREYRQQRIYRPFHAELDALLDQRRAFALATTVISIHSFTPRYHGIERPWHTGVIAQHDRVFGDRLLTALRADASLCVGDTLPDGPQHGVYHSLQRHGEERGLAGGMIEVRNDLLADAPAQERWAQRLANAIDRALPP
jgi:predicted N-formylglutamate amidohydrolase